MRCPNGWQTHSGGSTCVACAPGMFGINTCGSCSLGTFSTEPGQTSCVQCGLGSITAVSVFNVTDRSACVKCPPGRATVDVSLTQCPACNNGFYMQSSGASQCKQY